MCLQETFALNLTGPRLRVLQIQNLAQMNIRDFAHQKVGICSSQLSQPSELTGNPAAIIVDRSFTWMTVLQEIMQAIREAIAEDGSA